MRSKMLLLFALLLLLVGFGVTVMQETYSEPSEEKEVSTITACPLMQDGHFTRPGDNSLIPLSHEDPDPVIRVVPDEDFIYGQWWEPGAVITVTVDGVEYSTDADDWGYFYVPREEIDVEAGDDVTVYDGETTKTHTVTELVLEEVDENTVSGTAEADSELIVDVSDMFERIELDVNVDEDGNWEVDFMDEEDYEIHDGTYVGAIQEDADDDATFAYRQPAPYFDVLPHPDGTGRIHGLYWTFDETIDITILDDNDQEIDSFVIDSSEWGNFDTHRKDIKPGYTVKVDDPEYGKKTHLVTSLQITDHDIADKTVSGTADDDLSVYVMASDDEDNDDWLEVDVEGGLWEADFSDTEVNISGGTHIRAWQEDEERDCTVYGRTIDYPIFHIDPEANIIGGNNWKCEAEITITVDDDEFNTTAGDAEKIPWPEPDCGDFFYSNEIDEDFEIDYGNNIKVTDGVKPHEHEHTVKYLEVTDVDVENDTVSGTAAEDAWVDVEIFVGYGETTPRRRVQAGGDGDWKADFSQPCENEQGPEYEETYNIEQGTEGAADRRDDEQRAATRIHWDVAELPEPFFNVKPEFDHILGDDWPVGEDISIEIYEHEDSEETLHEVSTEADDVGHFNLENIGFDIQPGHWLEVRSEDVEKTHEVREIAISEVDTEDNTVSGTTDKDSLIQVAAYSCEDDSTLEVIADEGNWGVDFTEHYSIEAGSYGSAWQPDDEGDATWVDWRVEAPSFRVDPEDNGIWGHHWEDGAEIAVTIEYEGKELFADTTDADEYGDFSLDLWDDFNILPGDEVTVTDGITELTHTVTNLNIMEVDPDSDTVSGAAEAGTWVEVAINVDEGETTPRRRVQADDGEWEADFSEPCEHEDGPEYEEENDIESDTAGAADQGEDHSYTHIHFERAGASITGKVTDTDDEPIANAVVDADEIVEDDEYEDIGRIHTDDEGYYSLQGFVDGEYLAWAEAPGYETEETEFEYPDETEINFTLVSYEYDLTMAADPEEGGTATDETADSPYEKGDEVDILAEAEEGWEFDEWTADAGSFADAEDPDTTFTMPGEDVTVTANFEEVVVTPTIYWQHDDGELKAWCMDEDSKIDSEVFASVEAGWEVKGVTDQDADGQYLIYLYARDAGEIEVWVMEGFEKVDEFAITNPAADQETIDPVWDMMAIEDLTLNDEADIIWQQDDGELAVWLMEDNKAVQTGRILNFDGTFYVDDAWRIGAICDLMGDGEVEVIWHAVSGDFEDELAYWKLDLADPEEFAAADSGRLINIPPDDYTMKADWRLSDSVDLFKDGPDELLFQGRIDQQFEGEQAYWQMDDNVRDDAGRLDEIDKEWYLVGAAEVSVD